MTAPRETGGEPMAWAVMEPNGGPLLAVFPNEKEARTEASDLRAATGDTFPLVPLYPLAPPRPVEVTASDEMESAALRAFADYSGTSLARDDEGNYIQSGSVERLEEIVEVILTAALRAQPAGETVAWLLTFAVEQVIDGSPRPTWVKGFALVNVRDLGSTHPFATRPTLRPVPTHDHNEAMRFVRKRDAEAALSALEGTSYAALLKAEEHMWCDRTYPVAAPVADAGGTP